MLITEKNKKLNIDFDKDNAPDISVWKDVYGSHMKVGTRVYGDFPTVKKVEDYLYEITVDEMDEDYAFSEIINPFAACSQCRSGRYLGRNYDWLYSSDVEFIVRTTKKENRHESIGVASSSIKQKQMDKEEYSEDFKTIPYRILDGINDCGVYCGTNIVPAGDKGRTTGTHPDKKSLPNIAIPRFVLDNASSAKEAVKLLDTRNIYGIIYDGSAIEIHVLICDAEDTFIVEFVNNKMSVIPFENQKAIMTNFYLTDWDMSKGIKAKWLGNTDEEIAETGLTAHADGLERYLLLDEALNSVTSVDSMLDVMKRVEYTKTYNREMDPFWYSELLGTYPSPMEELTIYSEVEKFKEAKDIFISQYEHRDREGSPTWQTVHRAAYNLLDKSFKIIVQEGTEVYSYALNVNTPNISKRFRNKQEFIDSLGEE